MSIIFVIQTFEQMPKIHDFSFTLIDAIEYNNWYYNEKKYNYLYSNIEFKEFKGVYFSNWRCIPIGSIEFVLEFLKKFRNKIPKPIQIPDEFMSYKYLKRKCSINYTNTIKTPCFYKQIDIFKGVTEIEEKDDIIEVPMGKYFISEIVDFKTEWRAFVYKNELVGLQNYAGDFTLFPDVSFINKIIHNYNNPPIAYTIDVGVINKRTCLIEIHDFFSVGLYGFDNKNILPSMYIDWFKQFSKG